MTATPPDMAHDDESNNNYYVSHVVSAFIRGTVNKTNRKLLTAMKSALVSKKTFLTCILFSTNIT